MKPKLEKIAHDRHGFQLGALSENIYASYGGIVRAILPLGWYGTLMINGLEYGILRFSFSKEI